MKRIVTALAVLFFAIACTETDSSLQSESDFESALLAKITDEEVGLDNYFDTEESGEILMDEDEDLGRIIDGALELPIRWGRRNIETSREVLFDEYTEDDDTVFATVLTNISGELRVHSFQQNEQGEWFSADTLNKEFSDQAQQRLRFVRVDNSGDHETDWQLNGRSFVISNGNGNVGIQQIAYYAFDPESHELGELFLSIDVSEALNDFYTRESLISFQRGAYYHGQVGITNSNPDFDEYPDSGEIVYQHYGIDRHHKGKRPFFDDGNAPNLRPSFDETEGDDVFSNLIRMHRPPPEHSRRHLRTHFEVVDYETLLNPNGGYHCAMLGFPYRVD